MTPHTDVHTPHRQRRLIVVQWHGYRLPVAPPDPLHVWSTRLGLVVLLLAVAVVAQQGVRAALRSWGMP